MAAAVLLARADRRCTAIVVPMTIQIPDDLARRLEGIAAARKMSIKQLAIECSWVLLDRPTSPRAVLEAILPS